VESSQIRIGHFGIVARDLDKAIEFYTRIGLRLTERLEYPEEIGHGTAVSSAAFMRCDEKHHCLSIFTLRNVERGSGEHPAAPERELGYGLHHLAFELASPEALLSKRRELEQAGVPIVNDRRGGPGNHPRFYARDPDGHLVEFYWGIDIVGWAEGNPPRFDPIEEIDLQEFDFEEYVLEQRRRAVQTRSG
jgi:catechol 2,3-dioxygenase